MFSFPEMFRQNSEYIQNYKEVYLLS